MKYNVEVFNKRTGRQLASTNYQSNRYIVVENEDIGDPFFIRVSNFTTRRAVAIVSVDGCSVLTGQDASKHDSGYILERHEHYDIQGWRRGLDNVAEFLFTGLENSYAALTERPSNVGVIGVYFFEEVPIQKPSPYFSSANSIPRSKELNFEGETLRAIGTGYGKEVKSEVVESSFTRRESSEVKFVLYYNTRQQLKEWGVPVPVNIQHTLEAFPADKLKGPFVPAP